MVETIKTEDVALRKILVMKEKATVMGLMTEANTMVTRGVKEVFCVEATTATSLVLIFMKRMTAVRNLKKVQKIHILIHIL